MTFLESILDGFGKTFLFRFGDLDPVDDEVNRSFLFQFCSSLSLSSSSSLSLSLSSSSSSSSSSGSGTGSGTGSRLEKFPRGRL